MNFQPIPDLPAQWAPHALQHGEIACRDCGVAVLRPAVVDEFFSIGRDGQVGSSSISLGARTKVQLARCGTCSERRANAIGLVDELPRFRRYVGARDLAVERADRVLVVLSVVDASPEIIRDLVGSASGLIAAVDHFEAGPVASGWMARLTPVLARDANLRMASARAWSHIPDDEVAFLSGSLALLRRNRAEDVDLLPPPSGRACLLCGIGQMACRPNEIGMIWGPPRRVVASTVGGTGQPEPIVGHLCPSCTRAASEVGGIGGGAVMRALTAFLGLRIRDPELIIHPRVRAWCVTRRTLPNNAAWAHISDHEEVLLDLRLVGGSRSI